MLSWNEKTGEREYKEVTNLWVRKTNLLYEVKLPAHDPIVTTWNHPFWSVTQSAWVETKDLKEGEILSLKDGSEVTIESILHYDTEETTVYNFEVEGNHTYYVSEAGVLVHNQSNSYDAPWKTLDNNPEQLEKSRRERHDFLVEYPLLDGFLTKLPIVGPMLEYDHAVTYAERGQMDEAMQSAINAGLGAIPGKNILIQGGKIIVRQSAKPTNKKQGSPLQEWQRAKTESINRDLNQGRIDQKTADKLQNQVNQEYWMRTKQQGGNYSEKTFEKKIRELNLKKEGKR